MPSKIEWTDETLKRPLLRVDIVPCDKTARTALVVVFEKQRCTPTCAKNFRIIFAGIPQFSLFLSMVCAVLGQCDHFKIPRTIVCFIAVLVMHLFFAVKRTAKHLGRHKPMLVNITSNVGHRVPKLFDEHITSGRNSAPAFPIWIPFSWIDLTHAFRIASGV